MTNTQFQKRDFADESREITIKIGDFYALQAMADLIKRGLENPAQTMEHLDMTLEMIAQEHNIPAFEYGDKQQDKKNKKEA